MPSRRIVLRNGLTGRSTGGRVSRFPFESCSDQAVAEAGLSRKLLGDAFEDRGRRLRRVVGRTLTINQIDKRKQAITVVMVITLNVSEGVADQPPNLTPSRQTFREPLIKAWQKIPGQIESVRQARIPSQMPTMNARAIPWGVIWNRANREEETKIAKQGFHLLSKRRCR